MSDPTLQDADTPEEAPHVGPTVVGVGASAGGLAALKTFFDHVPEGSGLAFVVVVHLSPEHESHLAELLQPHVPFPVQQVTETVALEPDRVYVIPPGRNLSAVDTHLRLSPLEDERRNRAPVDHFFRTLSATHDGHSVGVVLTGTGSDGALGVREIKERNGLVVVQDPNQAEYDGMPQSAIATGVVDWVLPLAEIPGAILGFATTEPRVRVPPEGQDVEAEERRRLQRVLAQVRARTGRDFSRYKWATVLRRVARRMQMSSVEDLEAYLEILREDAGEVSALADDLLINVTSFFRDPDVFERLASDVVPALFQGRGPDQAVRVWSVGCATGEEAYSLAILLHEEAGRHEAPPSFQVFASDLHERSLERAREGFYPGDVEADVSAERLRRFFAKEDGGYRVRKEVREAVVFAPHNLLSDPPFSKLDVVSCRNVLIYLQRAVQREVVELFHYALRPGGVLVLGSSETTDARDLFRVEDKPLCLYRKRDVPAPDVRLPVFPIAYTVRAAAAADLEDAAAPRPAASFGALHERIVERYGPPSLLVGPGDRVVHVSARAGRYLVHPGGEITAHVLQLVRPELRVELRAALYAAREHGRPVRTDRVPVQFNGHAEPVALDVRPSPEPEDDGYVLVLFDEQPGPPQAPAPAALEDEGQARLQADLDRTRQRLQALVEEYETSQEEMRAANEELQSANEELRSTMEELETSKEELQSMNEELQTVNQENRHKVEELAQLSGDLQNLMAATQIATLFLDRELRIVRFTPGVADLFSVRMADRGRPLSDLTHRLGYDDLIEDARRVLATLVPVEREVEDDGGRAYLARVLPYRSAEDRIEGVVVTFVDITARRESEAALRRSEEHYRLLVEGAREYAILLLDPGGQITAWNTGAEAIFGYAEPEILGRGGDVLFTAEDRAAGVPQAEIETALEDGKAGDDRWQLRADGSRFWASGVMTALWTDGELRGFAKVLRDNTEKKAAEDALRASEARYRTLFESISQGFAVFDIVRDGGRAVDFRYLETNPAFRRQSGLEDPGGRTLREMIPGIEESWIETFARVAATGEPEHFVQEVAAMGRWYEVEAFRVGDLEGFRAGDLEGEHVAILFTDATERRASEDALQSSEERFRQAVEAAQLGTWVFDVDTGRTRFDDRALEVFGLEAEANDLETVLARIHPDDLPAFEAARRVALDPDAPDTFAETHRVVRPDGAVRWVRGQARVYFEDADGERVPVRAVGVVLDVTEQREAEAEVRALNAELEARVEDRTAEVRRLAAALTMAEQEERRRIALVLHDDLQQQLHGLSMLLAQAAKTDGPAAPLVRRSVEVLDQAVTLTRTLSSDLSPAVLDSGRLQEALDALADRTRGQYGLEVEVVPADEPHVLPPAVRVLVYQAVRELLFNVVKHADAGLVRVVVESVDGHAAVHVEDDGAGFDPGAETAGFGLTSVRNRLELVGGRLEVASASGEGTRATVVVPAETA